MTATARLLVPHVGAEADRLAHIEQKVDALAEQHANTRAEDLKRYAELIKQEITDYRAEQRADTRRDALIAGIGVALTVVGTVLLLLG